MSANGNSFAIQAAAIFLTRPLILLGILPSHTIASLQLFLQTALSCRADGVQLLSITPGSLPPLALQLACVAFGVKWVDWIQAVGGGAAFDLIIEPTRVFVVKKSNNQIGIIWVDRDATLPSPIPVCAPHSTVAEDSADVESDYSASDVEFDDAESSRPSSRSSNVSDSAFSFSSRSSASSKTSISSTSTSFSAPKKAEPKFTFTPAPAPSKTPTTKYLYQGGVSTVLTGGVMLGGAAHSSAPKKFMTPTNASVPITQAATKVPTLYTPPHRLRTHVASARIGQKPCSAAAPMWRRHTNSAAIAA